MVAPAPRVLQYLATLVRADYRIRYRHVAVEANPETLAIEIGGQRPPWWRFDVDPMAAQRNLEGYARRIVEAWAAEHPAHWA